MTQEPKPSKLPENVPLAVFREIYLPQLHTTLDRFVAQFESKLDVQDPRIRFHFLGLLETALSRLTSRSNLIDLLNPYDPSPVAFRGPYNSPAEALNDMRTQAGYNRTRLSQISGVDRTTIIKAETGAYKVGHKVYDKLMMAYQFSTSEKQQFDDLFFPKNITSS